VKKLTNKTSPQPNLHGFRTAYKLLRGENNREKAEGRVQDGTNEEGSTTTKTTEELDEETFTCSQDYLINMEIGKISEQQQTVATPATQDTNDQRSQATIKNPYVVTIPGAKQPLPATKPPPKATP